MLFQTEMASLKADNDRLNRALQHQPAGSPASAASNTSNSVPATPCTTNTQQHMDKRLSLGGPTKFGETFVVCFVEFL